jgi:hypothetical protein
MSRLGPSEYVEVLKGTASQVAEKLQGFEGARLQPCRNCQKMNVAFKAPRDVFGVLSPRTIRFSAASLAVPQLDQHQMDFSP